MRIVSQIALLVSVLALSVVCLSEPPQAIIPPGTVLPVQLNSTVKSNKAHVGQRITGEITQDVPLPSGSRIPRGAKVIGHVVAAQPASSANKAEISLRFDAVITKKQRVPITTHLRAIASMMAVSDAQVPESGPDRGTPPDWWTTS
jgi:hypothetical protein